MRQDLKEAKQEAKDLGIKTSGFSVSQDSQGEYTVSCGRTESSGYDVTDCRIYVIEELIYEATKHLDC